MLERSKITPEFANRVMQIDVVSLRSKRHAPASWFENPASGLHLPFRQACAPVSFERQRFSAARDRSGCWPWSTCAKSSGMCSRKATYRLLYYAVGHEGLGWMNRQPKLCENIHSRRPHFRRFGSGALAGLWYASVRPATSPRTTSDFGSAKGLNDETVPICGHGRSALAVHDYS